MEKHLKDAEHSQLLADVDRVWMNEELVEGGFQLMENLRALPEHDAASVFAACLTPHLRLNLKARLGLVGISVGELTPNLTIPSGVRGNLRSGSPILLITNNAPDNFHRPVEIAYAIGEMVYGHNNESVLKFVKALDSELALTEKIYGDYPQLANQVESDLSPTAESDQ